MVLTRSLSRQAAASTSDISAGAKGARYEDSVGGVAASPAHIYIEQSWRQRTVRLTRHAAAADSSASAVSRQRLDTADRHLTLTCRHHSPRSREYIVRSDAPLLGIVDYAVAAVTAMVLALIAFAWPEQLTRLQTALALLPLALSAAFKLRAVRQGQRYSFCLAHHANMLARSLTARAPPARLTPIVPCRHCVCRVCAVCVQVGCAAHNNFRVRPHLPSLLRPRGHRHGHTARGHQPLPHRRLPRPRAEGQEANGRRRRRGAAVKRSEREWQAACDCFRAAAASAVCHPLRVARNALRALRRTRIKSRLLVPFPKHALRIVSVFPALCALAPHNTAARQPVLRRPARPASRCGSPPAPPSGSSRPLCSRR